MSAAKRTRRKIVRKWAANAPAGQMRNMVKAYLLTGDETGIHSLLESDVPLNREDRQLVLRWGKGELRRERGRGAAPLGYIWQENRVSPLYAAAAELERIKASNRNARKKTKDKGMLIESLARKYSVDEITLAYLENRPRAEKIKMGIVPGDYTVTADGRFIVANERVTVLKPNPSR